MRSSLSGDHQSCPAGLIRLQVRGIQSLFNKRSQRCRVPVAPGTPRSFVEFDISRSIGADEGKKNPIEDLFYVLLRQWLLDYHELIAHEVERQRRDRKSVVEGKR